MTVAAILQDGPILVSRRIGERPHYHHGCYGAYILDPDLNNVEAVFHDRDTVNDPN